MIGHLRTSWRIFAGARPGLRFRENYRLRQSRRRGTFHPARISYIAVGTALIAGSALFGWMPVLGWGTGILGLGMIAGEFYPVARLDATLRLPGSRSRDLRGHVRTLLDNFR